MVTRRGVLRVVNGGLALALLSPAWAGAAHAQMLGDAQAFPDDYVVNLARSLAAKDFVPQAGDMDPLLADLSYTPASCSASLSTSTW